MKKKENPFQRSLCLLLAVLTVFFCLTACRSGGENPETTAEREAESPPKTMRYLVRDGKSGYVIVADFANDVEKDYAVSLQRKIHALCGVTVPLLDESENAGNGPKIRIGDLEAKQGRALFEKMGSSDFACGLADDGTLLLGATDAQMYVKLEAYLDGFLFSKAEEGLLPLEEFPDFVYSRDCPDGVFGNPVELLADGKSDYALVYPSSGDTSRLMAVAAAEYIESQTGIRLPVKSDSSEGEKEILIGDTARPLSESVMRRLNSSGEYGIWVDQDRLALAGYNGIGVIYAIERFTRLLGESGGNLTLYPSDCLISDCEITPYQPDMDACVSMYHEIYGTYGSYVEMRYATLSTADRADQELIEALIDRMGDSVALWLGSSTALYQGYYSKLDPEDYGRVALDRDGRIWIPEEFAKQYFNADLPSDADGYVDLTAYCEQNAGWELYVNKNRTLAVLTPPSGAPFADLNGQFGDYTNREYLTKMEELFTDPYRREPGNETEQTRTVITEAPFDPSLVWDYTKYSYRTNYSPGICAVRENGKEVLYVSYESCLVQDFRTETENVTYLKRSEDGGRTWTDVGSVNGMRWASVFEHNGSVYLLGTHVNGSKALIARYEISTGIFSWNNLGFVGGVGAPCTVLIANGRIYKASGDRIMSAPDDSDLLSPGSWTFSTAGAGDFLTKEWFRSASGVPDFKDYALGEGNVVMGSDGEVYLILRIDSDPYCGYAAIARVSADGSTLYRVEECDSLIEMPTSISKFSVRYDKEIGLYMAMTSLPTLKQGSSKQRNILALAVSRDLIHWQVADTLLVDREMMNATLSAAAHGFQYVDFVVSGDCLRMVVREATGAANTFHDGKYVTLYTVEHFRDLIRKNCPELLSAEGK